MKPPRLQLRLLFPWSNSYWVDKHEGKNWNRKKSRLILLGSLPINKQPRAWMSDWDGFKNNRNYTHHSPDILYEIVFGHHATTMNDLLLLQYLMTSLSYHSLTQVFDWNVKSLDIVFVDCKERRGGPYTTMRDALGHDYSSRSSCTNTRVVLLGLIWMYPRQTQRRYIYFWPRMALMFFMLKRGIN